LLAAVAAGEIATASAEIRTSAASGELPAAKTASASGEGKTTANAAHSAATVADENDGTGVARPS
jgi:hypothetical protein